MSIEHFLAHRHSYIISSAFIWRLSLLAEHGCCGADALPTSPVMLLEPLVLLLEEERVILDFSWLRYHQVRESRPARPLVPEGVVPRDSVCFLCACLALAMFEMSASRESVRPLGELRGRSRGRMDHHNPHWGAADGSRDRSAFPVAL